MNIHKATSAFETWLRSIGPVVDADLDYKHEQMAASVFGFFRATFYRWAQRWPSHCPSLTAAPEVLGVGDIHVDNYGTWRDAEGRLVWGINDLDEACALPYTADLVRLAASAVLAAEDDHLGIGRVEAARAILSGYHAALSCGGRPVVLAEHHSRLRRLATGDLRDPVRFWAKLSALPPALEHDRPAGAVALLRHALPESVASGEPRARRAGLGSLGLPRLVAVVDWQGGYLAREVKGLHPSAWVWATAPPPATAIRCRELLEQAVRCADPHTEVVAGPPAWLVRRLAPDCTRIELAELPAERDEAHLLRSMGWELANVHLGSTRAAAGILADLGVRGRDWLADAAGAMASDTRAEWEAWRG